MKKIVLSLFAVIVAASVLVFSPASAAPARAEEQAYTPLQVTGVSGPSYVDGNNCKFVVTFNTAVSDRTMEHFNASEDFKLSEFGEVYSPEFLAQLEEAGIMRSVLNNILLDGRSVQEYMDSDPSIADVAIMVHLKGTDMELHIQGMVNGQPTENAITDLDREFVLEMKEGLLFPTNTRVYETQRYVYNPATKLWRRQSESGEFLEPSADVEYLAYNGAQIAENGTLWMGYQTEVDEELFYIELVDESATWKLNKTVLTSGRNHMTITVTAGDGVTTGQYKFIMETATESLKDQLVEVGRTEKKEGCNNGQAASGMLLAALAASFLLKRRGI